MTHEIRDLIAETFHAGRRNNAVVRDSNGDPALCSYPVTTAGGQGFTCWQRHPTSGLYRQVHSIRTKPRTRFGSYGRATTLGPWQTRD